LPAGTSAMRRGNSSTWAASFSCRASGLPCASYLAPFSRSRHAPNLPGRTGIVIAFKRASVVILLKAWPRGLTHCPAAAPLLADISLLVWGRAMRSLHPPCSTPAPLARPMPMTHGCGPRSTPPRRRFSAVRDASLCMPSIVPDSFGKVKLRHAPSFFRLRQIRSCVSG